MPVYEEREKATCYLVPLSKRKLIKKTLAGVFQWILIIIALSFLWSMWSNFNLQDFTPIINSVFVLSFVLTAIAITVLLAYNYLYDKRYYYDIRMNEIIIRKGVIMKTELSVTYDKVEEVYIDQDLFDKVLGIYDVHLMTAAEHSQDFAHIDGLDENGAQKIKEMILSNVRNAAIKG